MWLFHPNSINNFLLAFLLLVMIVYFIIRGTKTKEVLFILIFMVQLFLWQLCFLFRNIYLDPVAAYPLYYFLNSGYTVFSYHALAMFSYYFITPVFEKELKIVFYSGLILSIIVIAYSIFIIFPHAPVIFFDTTLQIYDARPAPHRKYILLILLIFIALTAKNLIYKVYLLKSEQKSFVRNISIALLTGITAVVGVSFINIYYPINQYIQNTINTHIAGLLFIYFYLSYLSFYRVTFLYSDKAVFLVIFILIIVSSLSTSFTSMTHERSYKKEINEIVSIIWRDIEYSGINERTNNRIERLYSSKTSYVVLEDLTKSEIILFQGKPPVISSDQFTNHTTDGIILFHPGEEGQTLCFEKRVVKSILHVGIPYLSYRENVDVFVKANLLALLVEIAVIIIFFRFAILIGLTQPLRKIRSGITEIRKGNLHHKIDIPAQDELGLIAEQFNMMIYDLRITGEAIRRSEKKFRELTSMLPDVIYETDFQLNITFFNRTGSVITGYTEDDIAKGISLKNLFDDDECARLAHMLEHHLENRPFAITRQRLKKKDGEFIYVENNASVIFTGDCPTGIRGVIRDVTEKIQMEQNLIQAQKMETIGTLAGGIAHDFNNILTGITGTVSLLEVKLKKDNIPSREDIIKAISIIKKSSEKASNVVKQLLMVSRQQKPHFEIIDINDIVKNVYEICYNSFDKKIQFVFSYLSEGAFVIADDTQMTQMLLNICVNARDAMTIMRQKDHEQGGVLSLSIEKIINDQNLKDQYPDAIYNEYIKISVADTGIGIEENALSRVFDPFYTTKSKDKGTGLGLSMVYNIVKQHNGFIIINSVVHKGTTVAVYIPSAQFKNAVDITGLQQTEVRKHHGTIMVVDDDAMVQSICSDLLKVLGYSIINAFDGKQCIETYLERKNEIDAVILDVMMPVMSGDETFKELLKLNPVIKVLVSSGFREDPRISEMMVLGARGFIQKPYTIEKLANALSLVFENKYEIKSLE